VNPGLCGLSINGVSHPRPSPCESNNSPPGRHESFVLVERVILFAMESFEWKLLRVTSKAIPPWIPLLQHLTNLSQGWGVLKNLDSALSGRGDIDSVSPSQDREVLLRGFRDWAKDNKYAPVFTCMHVPDVVVTVAVRDRRELVELDLCERQIYRGSELFHAPQLEPLMIMDDRGFRRVRAGAEGLLLLVLLGVRYGGRPARQTLQRKGVIQLMRSDPEGVEAATLLFGAARGAASRLATAACGNGWARLPALWVEMRAAVLSLRNPRLLASRAEFRLRRRRECVILPILRRGRYIEGDVDSWISTAYAAKKRFGTV
jgi:hypothetical protein